jgi:hypothetical protein
MDFRTRTTGILLALLGAALAGTTLLVPDAGATSMIRLGLSDMAAASSSIVHGTVVSAESRWNAERTMIVTDVRVRVAETLKGAPAAEIVLVQPGGQVGNLRTEVAGASAFLPGEETILFLAPSSAGLQVAGLAQGRFTVVADPRTGRKTVRGMSLAGLDLVPKGGMKSLSPDDPGAAGPRPARASDLDAFLSNVRALVAGPGAKGGK